MGSTPPSACPPGGSHAWGKFSERSNGPDGSSRREDHTIRLQRPVDGIQPEEGGSGSDTHESLYRFTG